jgi:hypothetical protein
VNDEAAKKRRLIYRWDLDKTYLRTEFDSVRDLVKTAFEPAARKRTVPGAAALLREIRASDPAAIHILSGSPEQMRRVLEDKLRLDGIAWDSFTLKPSLRALVRGRFRFLRDQVGYKLGALLTSRAESEGTFGEILFGDDAEADAFVYSLYADICAGRVAEGTLVAVLERARVHEDDIPTLVRMAQRVPAEDRVRLIFIHLERVSPVSQFQDFGQRVCPFYNYFQPACALVETGALSGAAALRVGAEIVIHHGFSPDALLASFTDLARRGYVGATAANRLVEASASLGALHAAVPEKALERFVEDLARRLTDLADPRAFDPLAIDYVGLFSRDKARAGAAKRRAKYRAR